MSAVTVVRKNEDIEKVSLRKRKQLWFAIDIGIGYRTSDHILSFYTQNIILDYEPNYLGDNFDTSWTNLSNHNTDLRG